MLSVTLNGLAVANCEVLVVDDASPIGEDAVAAVVKVRFDGRSYERREENGGFSRAVNVGLDVARDEARDAVLVNSDIEFHHVGWLDALLNSPGDVVGALLLYPNRTAQHGGIYFSPHTRTFCELFKGAPHDLPALYTQRECPVTGALQLIRAETLQDVGVYDEGFRLGWEDVSYCLDVFKSGRKCIFQPRAMAFHHESYTRSRADERIQRWTAESWNYFITKHGSDDLKRWSYP